MVEQRDAYEKAQTERVEARAQAIVKDRLKPYLDGLRSEKRENRIHAAEGLYEEAQSIIRDTASGGAHNPLRRLEYYDQGKIAIANLESWKGEAEEVLVNEGAVAALRRLGLTDGIRRIAMGGGKDSVLAVAALGTMASNGDAVAYLFDVASVGPRGVAIAAVWELRENGCIDQLVTLSGTDKPIAAEARKALGEMLPELIANNEYGWVLAVAKNTQDPAVKKEAVKFLEGKIPELMNYGNWRDFLKFLAENGSGKAAEATRRKKAAALAGSIEATGSGMGGGASVE